MFMFDTVMFVVADVVVKLIAIKTASYAKRARNPKKPRLSDLKSM
jgi:hypothetical protein